MAQDIKKGGTHKAIDKESADNPDTAQSLNKSLEVNGKEDKENPSRDNFKYNIQRKYQLALVRNPLPALSILISYKIGLIKNNVSKGWFRSLLGCWVF